MKKKETISITVPEPCSEPWDEMTKTEKGRFCALCQHTVIDFSILTDGEIINIIKEAAGGKICGRYHSSQLGRELSPTPAIQPRSIQLLKRIAAAVLSFQAMATTSFAQKVKPAVTQQPAQDTPKNTATTPKRGIRGCVTDYITNKPLKGMKVSITRTGIETITGAAGTFFLTLPEGFTQNKVGLEVSYTDAADAPLPGTMFPFEEIDMDTISNTIDIDLYRYPVSSEKWVVLKSTRPYDNIVMGGIGGTAMLTKIDLPRKQGLFHAIGNLFRKKEKHHD